MAKPKKPKVPAVKKVIVSAGIARLTPDEKITHQHTTKNTCLSSTAYNASQPCKDAMALWTAKTNNLEQNQQQRNALLVQLGVLDEAEAVCIFEYDEAAEGFASAAKTTAAGDRSVVVGMGLGLRANPVHSPDPSPPTGLHVSVLKTKKIARLAWDATPGAKLYVAQGTTTPGNEASWNVVLGGGRSRALAGLIPGQLYTFRVAAVGKDGKQSGWSAHVEFAA